MRFTYDSEADAVYLYLVDEIHSGQVKSSQLVPLRIKGASATVSFDESDRALGVEFLGASKLLSGDLLRAIVEFREQSEAQGVPRELD